MIGMWSESKNETERERKKAEMNALFGESKKKRRKNERHKNCGLINKEDFFSRNKCALFMHVAVSISCTSISFRW